MLENSSHCQSDEQKKYLYLSASLKIPLREIHFDFSHASGPGGQHVNTTDSAVQLRFNILQCQAIPNEIRERLLQSGNAKINARGEIQVCSKEFRSQIRNKKMALDRLRKILLQASKKMKRRKKTAPPTASKEKRLQSKKRQAVKRQKRQAPEMND
ncbi:MAG: alternative ribosome rescue aminoacyl-tRNA hydrolase ArfB [Lentisphaeria bacterium]